MNIRKWQSFVNGEDDTEVRFDPTLSLLTESTFDRLDLTHLTKGEISLLMEGRKDNVLKKYANIIDDGVMESLLNFDEQYNYKHLEWMAKHVAMFEKSWDQEEQSQYAIAGVSDFIRYKQILPKKAINQYSSLDELFAAFEALKDARIKKAREKRMKRPGTKKYIDRGDATVIYEDDRYFVVRPFTYGASCHFGAKTKWCISQEGNTYFAKYTEADGKIFYFIKDDLKKPEDFNVKMAVEADGDKDNINFVQIWDRFDDPFDVHGPGQDLAYTLTDDFEMDEETAEAIAGAIEEHAYEYPPDSPLAKLEARITKGEWDGGYVTISSYVEDHDTPYISISADVEVPYVINNSLIIEFLNNDKIDIGEAEEDIKEALKTDEELYNRLKDEVDIGASQYWWPEDEDSDISVDISEKDAGWTCTITINGMHDRDHHAYMSSQIEEAESFCQYMQDEWGERNVGDIEEVLDNHLHRYIREVAIAASEGFKKVKDEFESGKHQVIKDLVYYEINTDHEEVETDLDLTMKFEYELNPEYLEAIFDAREREDGSKAPQKNWAAANSRLKADFSMSKRILEASMTNLYGAIYAEAAKQTKIEFGSGDNKSNARTNITDFVGDAPAQPDEIATYTYLDKESRDKFQDPKSDSEIPYGAKLTLHYEVNVDYRQTQDEMQLLVHFFRFISENYEQLNAYMYKNAELYAGNWSSEKIKILKENNYLNLTEHMLYLRELEKELKALKII